MKKLFISIVISFMLASNTSGAGTAEKVSEKLMQFARSNLVSIGADPRIVSAVKAENRKKKNIDQIKARDQEWRAEPGLNAFMQAMMESSCGKYLKAIQISEVIYAEIFVMDNQGANVCMSEKTSDYWQGDEVKFQQSFLGGKGAIHIGKVAFDESTQAYLVQISVPVKDGDNVIGAITFGIDIEEIDG